MPQSPQNPLLQLSGLNQRDNGDRAIHSKTWLNDQLVLKKREFKEAITRMGLAVPLRVKAAAQLKELQAELELISFKMRECQNQIDQLKSERERVQREYDRHNEESAPILRQLDESIELSMQHIRECRKSMTEESDLEEEQRVINDLQNTIKEVAVLKDRFRGRFTKVKSMEEELVRLKDAIKGDQLKQMDIPNGLSRLKVNLQNVQDLCAKQELRVERLLSEAKGAGDEVTVDEYPLNPKDGNPISLQDLVRCRDRMEMSIKEWDAKYPAGPLEMKRRFDQCELLFEKHQNKMNTVKCNVDAMREVMEQRKREFDSMKARCKAELSREFKLIMKQQGHDGELVVDYDNQNLDMTVHIEAHDGSRQIVNFKSLSGGERSFTQLALVMALQTFSGSPFCLYDEFDVFMDSVNRGNSIKILLKAALGRKDEPTPERQYIFITPLDVTPFFEHEDSSWPQSKMKISKLESPRRQE